MLLVLAAVSIPVVAVLIGANFTNSQSESQRAVEEQRAQEQALEAYLDEMGSLLLDRDLRSSEEDDEVRTLADARTSTVLSRVDGSRKTTVVLFLHQSKLIQRIEPIVSLNGADLSEVDLRGAELIGADLSEANLTKADLSGASLGFANLYRTDLSGADLTKAKLSTADLSRADLGRADLRAADLSAANLIEARGVTNKELEDQAESLKGTTMPDGSKHD